jgi:predicted DNA-binding transcriptional regulator AlpA
MTKKIGKDTAQLKTKTTKQEVIELISLQDLAAHLAVNPRTLKTWIAAGKIPAPSRIGNRKAYRWNVQKINSWLLAQESN